MLAWVPRRMLQGLLQEHVWSVVRKLVEDLVPFSVRRMYGGFDLGSAWA
jgi:hypothetical protein